MNITFEKGANFGDVSPVSVFKFENSYYIKLHSVYYAKREANALCLSTGELKHIKKEARVEPLHASFRLNELATSASTTFGAIVSGGFFLKTDSLSGCIYMKLDCSYTDYFGHGGGNAIELGDSSYSFRNLVYLSSSVPVDHINDSGITMSINN